MSRPLSSTLLLFLLVCLPETVLAQQAGVDTVAAVDAVAAPGAASSGSPRASVSSLTIQGENIYLDGVLQSEKYRPGMDVAIRDGKAVVVPRVPAAHTRKPAEKQGRPSALKAPSEPEKTVDQAQFKAGTQGVSQAEPLTRVEKRATRAETSALVNRGAAVRPVDTTSRAPKPGSDADIPPETRRLIENARRMSQ